MNPVLQMLLNAVVKYLEAHPDEVQRLVEAAIQWLLSELAKANAPK
jgi:hypothetical protein